MARSILSPVEISMSISKLKKFFQLESASGFLLLVVTAIALIVANSPLGPAYLFFTEHTAFWINDGLMVLFFLVIGLELKRNYLSGVFTNIKDLLLPALAALAGMIVPALIYTCVTYNNPVLLNGWSIPVATDIAFAVGVLILCAPRISPQLRMFLLWLAIFDDIGAIVLIAFFYTKYLSSIWLFCATLIFIALVLLNTLKIKNLIPYLLLGVGLWFCVLRSGIHPTIAGVLLAFTIPHNQNLKGGSLLTNLEARLHPIVAFLIMPIFAFANAGFAFTFSREAILNQLSLAIIAGLFLGKQIGIMVITFILTKLKLARLPVDSTWLEFYGVAVICGIGFTMSLFLGNLSFANNNTYLTELRLGVVLGSLLSGLSGAAVLYYSTRIKKKRNH